MKEKRLMSLVFAVFIFSLGFALAIDTQINVKTVSFANVNLNIQIKNGGNFEFLENLKGDAKGYGDISFTLSSDAEIFNIFASVKKNGESVAYEKIPNNVAGETLNLILGPEGFIPLKTPGSEEEETIFEEDNSTINKSLETTEAENINESSNQGVTGSSILNLSNLSKFKNQIIIGFIVFIGAFVALGLLRGNLKSRKESRKKSTDERKNELKSIERRLAKDEEELKKLREDKELQKGKEEIEEEKAKELEEDKS